MAEETCPDCGGNGEIPAGRNGDSPDHWITEECRRCHGRGTINR